MINFLSKLLLGSFLCLLAGCTGYQFGQGGTLAERYTTVSVPYVTGDQYGILTSCIVSDLARSGCFQYTHCGAALELKVSITDERDENIGFRYDRKKSGELTHSIIPTETRMVIQAEVIVEDTATHCTVLGPVLINAYVDIDHDYYSNRDGVNIFSLGQLNDVDAAFDAAQEPLYRALARKIVAYLCSSW